LAHGIILKINLKLTSYPAFIHSWQRTGRQTYNNS